MHVCTAKKGPILEAVQKDISRRTDIKQGQVQTLEIFPSTVRPPDLCIDSLIAAQSAQERVITETMGLKSFIGHFVFPWNPSMCVTCFQQAPLYYSNSKPWRLGE